MGCPRQEYWSELPFPPSGILPDPGVESRSPELQANSLPTELLEKPAQAPAMQGAIAEAATPAGTLVSDEFTQVQAPTSRDLYLLIFHRALIFLSLLSSRQLCLRP